MSPDTYKASPFLDVRIVDTGQEPVWLPFDEIHQQAIPSPQPTHFVFHSAFCCSTLMSRYLDSLDRFLVLREPHLLFEMISLERFRATKLLPPMDISDWELVYQFVVDLLSRRWAPDRPVVVKANDGVNCRIASLLSAHSENQGLFLYSTLERFLTSALKYPHRDEFAAMRARELTMDQYNSEGKIDFDPARLNRHQTAALVWVRQMKLYQAALQTDVADQLLSVDTQDFIEDPATIICAFLHHIGWDIDESEIRALISSNAQMSHSKAGKEQYDTERRETDYVTARSQFSGEIEAGIEWVIRYYGEDFAVNSLSRPLIDV